MAIILKANEVNLFASSVFFLFSGTIHRSLRHTTYETVFVTTAVEHLFTQIVPVYDLSLVF
jgi:hypothetical protein